MTFLSLSRRFKLDYVHRCTMHIDAHTQSNVSYLNKLWNFCVNEENAFAFRIHTKKINTKKVNNERKLTKMKRKKSTRKAECCWCSSVQESLCYCMHLLLRYECECTTRKHTFSADMMCAREDTTQSPYIILCAIILDCYFLFANVFVYANMLCAFERKKYELNFNFNSFSSSSHLISIFRNTCARFNDWQHDFTDFPHILRWHGLMAVVVVVVVLLLLTMIMIMIMIYVPVFKTLN